VTHTHQPDTGWLHRLQQTKQRIERVIGVAGVRADDASVNFVWPASNMSRGAKSKHLEHPETASIALGMRLRTASRSPLETKSFDGAAIRSGNHLVAREVIHLVAREVIL
jgi:hypothetical protein